MYKIFFSLFAFLTLMSSFKVEAISLDQARSQGVVCEGTNGLLSPVGSPSGDVQQLIRSINAQRNQEYQAIQQSQPGTSLNQVQSIAAQEIMSSVPAGTYIMGPGGTCNPK